MPSLIPQAGSSLSRGARSVFDKRHVVSDLDQDLLQSRAVGSVQRSRDKHSNSALQGSKDVRKDVPLGGANRVGKAPVRGDRAPCPYRARLARSVVAPGDNGIPAAGAGSCEVL